MKSKFLSLNSGDLVKSAIMAGLTAIGGVIIPVLQSGALPTKEVFVSALLTGLGVAFAYLLKNAFTNSEDQFAKTEPK